MTSKGTKMTTLSPIKLAHSDIFMMIDSNPKLADSTKMQYKKALTNALAAGVNLTDAGSLADYAANLSKSSRAFLKAAIKLWSRHVVTQAKSQATPENIAAIQATEARFEALNDTIKVEASKGQTSRSRARAISAFSATLRGRKVDPVKVSRFSITAIQSASKREPFWKAIITMRP